jgi:hypothetical protein
MNSSAQGASTASTDETINSRIGELNFESGYPSQQTLSKLYNELDFQRASQVYLWGLPAIGLLELKHAQNEIFKARNGEWIGMISFDEKLGLLTPNYTTPYVVSIADLGVVGPDKGQGGKYLVLPPGHTDISADGCIMVLRQAIRSSSV